MGMGMGMMGMMRILRMMRMKAIMLLAMMVVDVDGNDDDDDDDDDVYDVVWCSFVICGRLYALSQHCGLIGCVYLASLTSAVRTCIGNGFRLVVDYL